MELNDGYDRAVVVMHAKSVVEVILTNTEQLTGAMNRARRYYLDLATEMPDELVEAAYYQAVEANSLIRVLPVYTVTKEQYS